MRAQKRWSFTKTNPVWRAAPGSTSQKESWGNVPDQIEPQLTIKKNPKLPLDGAGHHCSALWDCGSHLQCVANLFNVNPSHLIWFIKASCSLIFLLGFPTHHCGIVQPAGVCFVNENLHNVKPFVFWEGNQQAHTCALDAVGMPLYLGFKHTTVVLLCHPEMLTFGNGHLRNLKPFVSRSKPLGAEFSERKLRKCFQRNAELSPDGAHNSNEKISH